MRLLKSNWVFAWILFTAIFFQAGITRAQSALNYYMGNWSLSTRFLPNDSADFIGLPHPYSTPTLKGSKMFQEMYYWDTYFINRGLLAYGSHPQRGGASTPDENLAIAQAINNANNLIFLVNKFGFVPNANRYSMTNRSQPPLLGAMIADIFAVTQDTAWLRLALAALAKEHQWWMENRSVNLSPKEYAGIKFHKNETAFLRLNHYGHNADNAFLIRFSRFLSGRLGAPYDSLYLKVNLDSFVGGYGQKQPKGFRLVGHLLAEAESGWDFTPRFNARCKNIAALDLNCLLYLTEKTLEDGYKTLGDRKTSTRWKRRSEIRKSLINKLLYDKHTGWFWDYDLSKRAINFNANAAQFMPYFVGLPKHNKQTKWALSELASRFVSKYGVHPCLPVGLDSINVENRVLWKTQWDSPNAWPPLTHFTVKGLENYARGLGKLSNLILNISRIQLMYTYLESVESQFATTGKFWEKYNVNTGGLEVTNEYEMPDFFGWTAGVYAEYALELVGP